MILNILFYNSMIIWILLTWPVRRLVLIFVVSSANCHGDAGFVTRLVLINLSYFAGVNLSLKKFMFKDALKATPSPLSISWWLCQTWWSWWFQKYPKQPIQTSWSFFLLACFSCLNVFFPNNVDSEVGTGFIGENRVEHASKLWVESASLLCCVSWSSPEKWHSNGKLINYSSFFRWKSLYYTTPMLNPAFTKHLNKDISLQSLLKSKNHVHWKIHFFFKKHFNLTDGTCDTNIWIFASLSACTIMIQYSFD